MLCKTVASGTCTNPFYFTQISECRWRCSCQGRYLAQIDWQIFKSMINATNLWHTILPKNIEKIVLSDSLPLAAIVRSSNRLDNLVRACVVQTGDGLMWLDALPWVGWQHWQQVNLSWQTWQDFLENSVVNKSLFTTIAHYKNMVWFCTMWIADCDYFCLANTYATYIYNVINIEMHEKQWSLYLLVAPLNS
jgi:hypothetical protein